MNLPITPALVAELEKVPSRFRLAWRFYWRTFPVASWREAWRWAGTLWAWQLHMTIESERMDQEARRLKP